MAQADAREGDVPPAGRKRRIWARAFRAFVILLFVAIAIAWWQRREIASELIEDVFRDNGIEASYTVESIGTNRQVLTDIVLGNPDRPDLTIARLELEIVPRFGSPDLRRLWLTEPRLYGTLRDGQLSFGQLDPLIFTGSDAPFEFPDVALDIADGRALIASDYGDIGLRLAGAGHLRGGFEGELAATARNLSAGGCDADRPTLYGTVSVDAERPRFTGPLRVASLTCPNADVAIADASLVLSGGTDRNLADFEARYELAAGRAEQGSTSLAGVTGEGQVRWRDGNLLAAYDIAAERFASAAGNAADFASSGTVRAGNSFDRVQAEGDLRLADVEPSLRVYEQLAAAEEATRGSLLQPLLTQFRTSLARQLPGSSLRADYDARRIGRISSVNVPQAVLSGRSGALASLTQGRLLLGSGGLPRFSGNFTTGGEGMPRIAGRMEQDAGGGLEMRLAMREYAAGDARLAIPAMRLSQGRGGVIRLEGRALASGPLPGGFARDLELPIDGTIGQGGALAVWNGCRQVRFASLAISNVTLDRQSLTLCPPAGRPILEYGPAGLRLAAGANSLDMRGTLARTPIRVRSGPVGFAWPGALVARDLDISLGPADKAQRFAITDLRADLSRAGIGGEFAGADVFLASVPLDVLDASGAWTYAANRLTLADTRFTLEDRQDPPRFVPMVAEGASLTLYDNLITADALLRHPGTGREVVQADIRHDLARGSGTADLDVAALDFGPGFQPTDLTRLALGVVANVEGTVTGEGNIAWGPDGVTSTGRFGSDDLDFAAAFGPVRGASGTLLFTDLLGLTTAPDQRFTLQSVNPGIEVTEGEVGLQLVGGEVLQVTGGSWPFMGGTLELRPVAINIGAQESRTYELVITGLEAARFVERMGLSNLAASGTFDGRIPIVFDADGNGQLVGGYLVSRPGGGHVSYVGDLTYEDLSLFANYAFQALRDLRFNRMEILMDGPLTGELVTRVRFEGVGQGETAERNFVTRAIAGLPIDLRVNIRAPFYKLITSIRALYDPESLRDPRLLGLLGDDGQRLREAIDQDTVDARDEAIEAEEERRLQEQRDGTDTDIQQDESERVP